jgi:ribosomal protein L37AE/L43A
MNNSSQHCHKCNKKVMTRFINSGWFGYDCDNCKASHSVQILNVVPKAASMNMAELVSQLNKILGE